MTDDRHAQELLAQDITIANMQARHEQELCAYQITVDNLRAELEVARKDAARYRELRNGSNWPAAFAAYDAPEPLTKDALDEAIDSAFIQGSKGCYYCRSSSYRQDGRGDGMKPVLYRYRDSESVIRAMEGYTPPEGWEPLYSQAQVENLLSMLSSEVEKAVATERERCAKVCDAVARRQSYGHAKAAAGDCADFIRSGE